QERVGEPALGPGLQAIASRRWLIQALADMGAFAEGIAIAEDTLQLAEVDGHPYTLVIAYTVVGYLYLGQGEVHQAIPYLERSLDLCHTWGIQQSRIWLNWALGYALALSCRIPEALAVLERTVGQAPLTYLTGRPLLNAFCWVVESYRRAGHLAKAHTLA